MRPRLDVWLWLAHRATAVLLAPLILVHLVTMILAVRGGLDAAEIVARTRGSLVWGGFYFLFVAAAAVHASIGLRSFLIEQVRLGQAAATWLGGVIGFALLWLGGRAVAGLVF